MFIHYDIPVFKPGWDHRQYETRPEASVFNPKKLNTDQWMEAAKAMGAKYAVFVAKHGSGFMCWQSDLYPYGMKQSPYKNGQGDIVRDFVNSCRKYGIRPGIYAHMGCNGYLEVDNPGLVNRGKGGDPEKQARYAKICEGMLTELWGNYGELSEIWFDGGVLDPAKGGPVMLPILHKLQPKAIVFQGPAASIRWIGNEDGVAPYPCWATVPDVRDYNGPGSPEGQKWLPGECDVPIRQGVWLWEPNTEDRLFFRGSTHGQVLSLRGAELQFAAQCQSRPGRADSRAGYEAVQGVRRRDPAAVCSEHRRDVWQRRVGGVGTG